MTVRAKQKQKDRDTYKNYIDLKQLNEDQWSKLCEQFRHKDQNYYKATIKEWWIENEVAHIAFNLPYFDDIFCTQMSAEIHPENKSEFERFIENQGHSFSKIDPLPQGSKIEVQAKRKNNQIEFIPTQSPSTSKNIIDRRPEIGGLFLGLIPILNYLVLIESIQEIKRKPSNSEFTEWENVQFLKGTITSIIISTVILTIGALYYFGYIIV